VDRLSLKNIKKMSGKGKPVLADVKSFYSRAEADRLGFLYWRL